MPVPASTAHICLRWSLVKNSLLGAALFIPLIVAGVGSAQSTQEFQLGNQPSAQAQKKQAQKPGNRTQQTASGPAASSGGLGWGSSIDVGRNARAAEDALKRGDYAAAMTFAQRVTQSAPNDPRNWFLLGYTSRLAGRYSTSLDAFNRGLSKNPNSVEGLSG